MSAAELTREQVRALRALRRARDCGAGFHLLVGDHRTICGQPVRYVEDDGGPTCPWGVPLYDVDAHRVIECVGRTE